jgi:hypothetical protein
VAGKAEGARFRSGIGRIHRTPVGVRYAWMARFAVLMRTLLLKRQTRAALTGRCGIDSGLMKPFCNRVPINFDAWATQGLAFRGE